MIKPHPFESFNFYPLEGWNAFTSYRFNIIHLPEQGLIRLRLYEGSALVVDSGNIIDNRADRLMGGKLGVYCDSQAFISWSALRYRSLGFYSAAFIDIDIFIYLMCRCLAKTFVPPPTSLPTTTTATTSSSSVTKKPSFAPLSSSSSSSSIEKIQMG